MLLRHVFVMLVLILLTACAGEPEIEGEARGVAEQDLRPASILDRMSWLNGVWVRQSPRGTSYEQWHPDDSGMTGVAYKISDGDTTVTERLWLIADDGNVYYVALPNENPTPTRFILTDADSLITIFENPRHDFPTTIIYRNIQPDSFVASIAGPMGDSTRQIDFPFKRQM